MELIEAGTVADLPGGRVYRRIIEVPAIRAISSNRRFNYYFQLFSLAVFYLALATMFISFVKNRPFFGVIMNVAARHALLSQRIKISKSLLAGERSLLRK